MEDEDSEQDAEDQEDQEDQGCWGKVNQGPGGSRRKGKEGETAEEMTRASIHRIIHRGLKPCVICVKES